MRCLILVPVRLVLYWEGNSSDLSGITTDLYTCKTLTHEVFLLEHFLFILKALVIWISRWLRGKKSPPSVLKHNVKTVMRKSL